MKKIFIFLLLLGILTSCEDVLEVSPKNSVTFENYFQSEQDLQALTYAGHDYLRTAHAVSYWASYYPARIGMLADTIGSESIRRLSPAFYYEGCWPSMWDKHYQVISQANTLINNVDKVKNVSQSRIDYYLGQCLFLRAHEYFYIAKVWGEAPLVEVATTIERKAKASTQELLDFAIKDAKRAVELLPPYGQLRDMAGNPIDVKQIPGKHTAYALLAHIYAWKASICKHDESWALAEAAATEVIDRGNYSLVSTAEEICTDVMVRNSVESIFELNINYSEIPSWMAGRWEIHPQKNYASYPVLPNHGLGSLGRRSTKIKATTVESMYAPTDERRAAYFYKLDSLKNAPETKGNASLYKWRKKYMYDQGWGLSFVNFDGNVVKYRLAGIILLRAECRVRQGHNGDAITDLNTVRGRSNAPLYEESEGDLRYIIFKEREKELLLEQHRYFDCVRNGYLSEISEVYGELTEQEIQDGALYMPIPPRAFTDNTLMRQNTYWLKRW